MRKISTKIIALLGLMVFLICTGLGVVCFNTSKNSLVEILEETMPKVAVEAAITIEDGIQNQLNTLNIIASLDILSVLEESDADCSKVVKLMSDEVTRSGHKQMILVDKNGKALFDNGTTDDLSDNSIVKDVLSGKEIVTEPALDNQSSGIIMIYAVPVRIDGKISGALLAVRDGMELSDFAGRIKFGKTGDAFIINSQGKTIAHSNKDILLNVIDAVKLRSTSVSADTNAVDLISSATETDASTDAVSSPTVDADAKQADGEGSLAKEIGFEGFSEVQRQMTEGVTGFSEYKYHGTSKVLGFAPLEKYGWSIAVSADRSEMLSGMNTLAINFLIISLLFLLAGLVVAYFIGKGISIPIVRLSREGYIMSKGDFSHDMEDIYTRRQDEIGELARSFNSINTNVAKIIRNVVEEANAVNKAIKNVDENMFSLTSEINEMSEIIEKLALKMEENSSAAEEMNATSNEIEGAIDSIANETQHNAVTASEVSKRAASLKETAIDSQQKAQEILMDVAVRLRDAIEQSRAVEKIQVLSDAILAISSKTNLLALNAAIEAASAGNAGSGFTVVAEEIKKLAEKSKQTVNEIKDVTKTIIESVHVLSESAEQVLGFIETKVIKDYDMLVETGELYDNDARLLNDMVANLSATTEELYSSIENMSQAIESVAAASEKGATETSDLASNAEVIVKRTGEVLSKTNDVSKSVDRLIELVSVFKV